jgi:sugar (pentulose or hexulose) kinase
LVGLGKDLNSLVESYIQSTKPGANNTFAFLGPQMMNFKNTTDIKRSVFIFPSHSSISDIVSDRSTFTRAILENIGFGILENYNALVELAPNKKINRVFCGGGMANSKGFVKIIADILGKDVVIPKIKESAYLGQLVNCMIALGTFKNHTEAVKKLIELETIKYNPANTNEYKKIYGQWKIYKEKTDSL